MSNRTLSDPRVVISHPQRNGTRSERWLRRANRRSQARTPVMANSTAPREEKGQTGISVWVASRFALAATSVVLIVASLALPGVVSDASAQRLISISSPQRTASVRVAVGKSEDVRTDAGF